MREKLYELFKISNTRYPFTKHPNTEKSVTRMKYGPERSIKMSFGALGRANSMCLLNRGLHVKELNEFLKCLQSESLPSDSATCIKAAT